MDNGANSFPFQEIYKLISSVTSDNILKSNINHVRLNLRQANRFVLQHAAISFCNSVLFIIQFVKMA